MVFIYHYFPSVPFVTVMVGYSMYLIVKKHPKAKKFAYVYAALAVGLFAMFYPVLTLLAKASMTLMFTRLLKKQLKHLM